MSASVIIVGAGPGGLAVAACLERAGISSVILDEAGQVAESWRRHYDRLRLHTTRDHSALPFLPMPRDYPQYPSRDQVVAYLERYAAHFRLQPRFGERVTHAARIGDVWEVQTAAGAYRAPILVVAAGYNREPVMPTWPGQDSFGGPILHSSQYTTGAAYRGQDVLVVGFGNSGGEIAIDLHEQGARPSIAVRNPVNVVPREVFGIPVLSLGLIQRLFSPAVADRITAPLIRALVGDIEAIGLRKLPYGPATQVRTHGRIPLIDIGTIDLIRRGQISVRPGLDRFDPGHAVFTDGTRTRFDAVITATGYRPHVDFLDANTTAIDREGRPRSSGGETTEPGLFFCGYHVSPNGMLREITVEAQRLVALIARASNRPV